MREASDSRVVDIAQDLARHIDVIREEYRNLDAPILDVHRHAGAGPEYVALLSQHKRNGWTSSWQVGTTEPNASWLTYAIKSGDWFHPETVERCPRTFELLMDPVYDVAAFSLFRGLSLLGPHAHPDLSYEHPIVHLGIEVEAGKSFLVVDGTFIEEREGAVISFDGTHEHYALNASLRDRVILYVELDLTRLR